MKSILKSHFAPKRLTIAEHYRFHNCMQAESESVSDFAANLKKLASTCNFGTFLPGALHDRFVCGLQSTSLQKKLLADDHTFQQALKVALNHEAAEKDVAGLNPKPADTVHKIRPFNFTRKPPGSGRDKSRCVLVVVKVTIAEVIVDTIISPVIHVANMATFPVHASPQPLSTKLTTHTPSMENPPDPFTVSMYKVGSNNQALMVPVEIQGQSLLMEIRWQAYQLFLKKPIKNISRTFLLCEAMPVCTPTLEEPFLFAANSLPPYTTKHSKQIFPLVW